MEIVGIGALDLHIDDLALAQWSPRDNMNFAVDFGRVARAAALPARARLIDDDRKRLPILSLSLRALIFWECCIRRL